MTTINIGDTLLIPSGPSHHLFVVVLGPITTPLNEILMLPICTKTTRSDNNCLIAPGEHAFITKDSFVDYSFGRIEPLAAILRGLKNGIIVQNVPVTDLLLDKIVAGITQSKRTKPFIKMFLKDNP